jgi:biotin carboxyl carrier protein
MHFDLLAGANKYSVEVKEKHPSVLVRVGRKKFEVTLEEKKEPNRYAVHVNGRIRDVILDDETETSITIQIGGERLILQRFRSSVASNTGAELVAPSSEESSLHSPIPGRIVSVEVRANSLVRAGAPVVTIESMKMESMVRSDRAGRINQVLVKAGDAIERGQALVIFDKSG